MHRALAVGLLSAGVAGGLLDGVVWPGPPLALFRPQLMLALVAAALIALVVGARRVGLVGVVAAGLAAALLVPALRDSGPESPPSAGPTVEVLALNLHHGNRDVSAVTGLIEEEHPDIVALSELTPAWAGALAPALRPYGARAAEPQEGSTGIGLFGRAHLEDPAIVRLRDGGRPAVEAWLDLFGRGGGCSSST